MVDKDNGDAALIRDALERGNVLVIGGVHIAVSGVGFSHLLQRVDDDQLRFRVFAQMLFDLFLQTAMQLFRDDAKAQFGYRLLVQPVHPSLDASVGVLQTEIQHIALLRFALPDGKSL